MTATATAIVLEVGVPALPERRELVPRPARHGYACDVVTLVDDRRGDLVPEIPPRVYAGIPSWRSRRTWLTALTGHPRLIEAARRYETCAERVVQVMELAADYATTGTGRGIAVSHKTLARALGVTKKTIQRAFWAAEDLGLLVLAVAGSDMTMEMRYQILNRYKRGHRRRGWSKLPNVYAATLPRWMDPQPLRSKPKPVRGTAFAKRAVDNEGPIAAAAFINVYPPVGGPPDRISLAIPHHKTKAFTDVCAQSIHRTEETQRTDAPRPTIKAHLKSGVRAARPIEPVLRALGEALRAELAGFKRVSLRRICPVLTDFARAGVSAKRIADGLDSFLQANNLSWISDWPPGREDEQAKYLAALIVRARRSHHLDV